jgi:hypothetical protein
MTSPIDPFWLTRLPVRVAVSPREVRRRGPQPWGPQGVPGARRVANHRDHGEQ